MSTWKSLALAAMAAVALQVSPALAAEAQVASGGANVRAGPGFGYPIIASLPGGRTVNAGRCLEGGRWCRVRFRGRAGWVAFSRLSFPYTGRPGDEDRHIGAEGEPQRSYSRILGIVVDKPGYCYALSHSGVGIIVKCP